MAGRLVARAEELAKSDKAAALNAVELAMSQITSLLLSLGAAPTRDPQKAMEEHRPFKSGAGVFWPSVTTVAAA